MASNEAKLVSYTQIVQLENAVTKKLRVAVMFGGRSAEHEVSLNSARNVAAALNKDKYEVVLIGIGKDGKWYLNDQSKFLLEKPTPEFVTLTASQKGISLLPGEWGSGGALVSGSADKGIGNVDVVLPILHGPYGEDGTVQGLLKLANVPYVGCGVLASAVGMDKDVMKRLLRDAGLPIGKFMTLTNVTRKNVSFADVKQQLGMPCFVKPANLGSSVGISKARDENELKKAMDLAFKYDSKILIEQEIIGREIEFSVLGNEDPQVSVPGEIRTKGGHDFYSYDAKYLDDKGAELDIPAKMSSELIKKGQEIALKTYIALCCEGLSRVDMFLTEKGEFIVNEINTLPGFTNISMYPKLWEASGLSYSDLLDKLISLALDRFKREQALEVGRA